MIFRVILISILAVAGLSSCRQNKSITVPHDYNGFLQDKFVKQHIDDVSKEIVFWDRKLLYDTTNYVFKTELATYYLKLFKLNGNIAFLIKGDSLLKAGSAKVNNTIPELLYSLSQSSIGRHQFTDAALYNEAAKKIQGDPYTIALLQFDADMELGKYNEAYSSLRKIADRTSFDYLIRKAKWEDHKGNLDGAIKIMEQAFNKVKEKKKSLYCWTLSNLADMYGHAGRLKEAYTAYINVLQKDPANLYCLKGIARIVWLHDKNPVEAKRIINFILSQTAMPDLKLMLAEINSTENNNDGAEGLLQSFTATVTKPEYGAMYNKYLIDLYNEDLKQPAKAMLLAQVELKNRATPETYDWLSWSYYRNGNIDEAFKTAQDFVFNKTFEPDALMHTAFIYAAKGKKEEARKMFRECLESSFELGPLAIAKIKNQLSSL
jgi:Tetratricopeptide repeat